MGRFALEFFVQGRGWVGQSELGLEGGLASREEAENLAAYVIDSRMRVADHPYGSRIGDIVGFRIVEIGETARIQLSPEALNFKFSEVKHRFYKRGDAYMLYKYWSWPD